MATYNVGAGQTYTTLHTALASGVLSDGDTIQLLAGYNETESVGSGVTWPDNLTVQGDPLSPSSRQLTWNNPGDTSDSYVVLVNNAATGVKFSGITFNYTGTATTYSTVYRGGWSGHSDIVFEDCVLNSSGLFAMRVVGDDLVVRRCRVDNTSNTTSTTTVGMWAGTSTVESSLFIGWTKYAILVSTGTIVNTTVYSNKDASLLNTSALIVYVTANGTTIANCVIQTVNSVNYHKGIVANSSGTTGTIKNTIISGFYDDISAAGFTLTNVLETPAIGTSLVLTDPAAGNYYPAEGGIADGTGDTASKPSGGDLNRQAFDTPPAIGCLEIIPPIPLPDRRPDNYEQPVKNFGGHLSDILWKMASTPQLVAWNPQGSELSFTSSDISTAGGTLYNGYLMLGSGTFLGGSRIDYSIDIEWSSTANDTQSIDLDMVLTCAGSSPSDEVVISTDSGSGHLLNITSSTTYRNADGLMRVEGTISCVAFGSDINIYHTWHPMAQYNYNRRARALRHYGAFYLRDPGSKDMDSLQLKWATSGSSSSEVFAVKRFQAMVWPSSAIEYRTSGGTGW